MEEMLTVPKVLWPEHWRSEAPVTLLFLKAKLDFFLSSVKA